MVVFYFLSVSVRPSTYFLIKKVFLALGQKNETSLHRKSATEICRGLREIFFISKGLLSVKKHIYLPLLSLEEASSSGLSMTLPNGIRIGLDGMSMEDLSRLLFNMGRHD